MTTTTTTSLRRYILYIFHFRLLQRRVKMWTRTRRLVVEEEVIQVVDIDSYEANLTRERERRERMKSEQNRLHSFPSLWLAKYHQLDVSVAQRLAKAGFYGSYGGYTQCFSCGLCKPLYFWRKGLDPETVHRRERPNCKFITGQSDNVPIDNELQENTKTPTDTGDSGVSGPRRFPIFKSSKSQQNQEVQQPNNNQTKLRSESQHLEPDTGTKPKRIGGGGKPTTSPIAREERSTLDTRGSWCVSKETATRKPITSQEHVDRENLTRATGKQAENVSSNMRYI